MVNVLKKVCISIWVDKFNDYQLKIDNSLQINFDIESWEYNTKYCTDIKLLKINIYISCNHSRYTKHYL